MPLNRLLIYARDIEATALFYEKYFGLQPRFSQTD